MCYNKKMKEYQWGSSLKEEIFRLLVNEGSGHDYYHAERVAGMAENIIQAEKLRVDQETVRAAAWLHDVGYVKLI